MEAITLNELQHFLQGCEIIKPQEEPINKELFECASQEFLIKFLRFLNNIWDGEKPPTEF